MFSTKFWFTLVVLAMGISVALLLLARNTYNLAREDDARRLLLKDRDQAWALLKSESRVRLDELLRVAGDQQVLKLLRKASATPEKVTSDDRATLATALKQQNDNLESYGGDLLVAVDRNGKSIAHVWDDGPDKAGYGLGGFPAVQSALRGFMQDDVWALSTDATNAAKVKVFRVATRPVIGGGQYIGAIVHGQHLDDEFATAVAKRLGAQVIFFRGQVVIASGLPDMAEGEQPLSEQLIATPLPQLLADETFRANGRSDIVPVGDNVVAVYALAMGEASRVEGSNVGYAIARRVPTIDSSYTFVTAASLEEWGDLFKSTPGIIIIASVFMVLFLGFVFFILEHGRPARTLRREVSRLANREVDRLNIYAVARMYRRTAESINKAIDKAVADVAEKLGNKPADIDQILGPRESGERVSSALFTFPDAAQGEEIPSVPPAPAGEGPPGAQPPMPGQAPPAAPAAPKQPPSQSEALASPPPSAPAMAPFGASAEPEPVPEPVPEPEPEPAPEPMQPPPAQSPVAAPQAPSPAGFVPSLYGDEDDDDDEDKTEIAGVPEELLRAAQRDEMPPEPDEGTYFRQIFDQFVSTKKQCGERTDNLQFERFSQTLKRNRDALIERYGCKTVRFQVYVKEGKAALKATPVRS